MAHGKMKRFTAKPEAGPQPTGPAPAFGAGNPRGRPFAAAKTGTKGKAKKKGPVASYGGKKRRKKKYPMARY